MRKKNKILNEKPKISNKYCEFRDKILTKIFAKFNKNFRFSRRRFNENSESLILSVDNMAIYADNSTYLNKVNKNGLSEQKRRIWGKNVFFLHPLITSH